MLEDSFKIGGNASDISLWSDMRRAKIYRELWLLSAWGNIKKRYRRTSLGPVWAVISNLLFASFVVIVFNDKFNMPVVDFALHVYLGYSLWMFISESMGAGGDVFSSEIGLISQYRYPYVGFIYKHLLIRTILLLHNLPVMIVIYMIHGIELKDVLLFLLGFSVLLINSFFYSIWSSIVSAKFKDYSVFVSNIMRFMFFATPIIWVPELLDSNSMKAIIVFYNPFSHFLEICRGPLLGHSVAVSSWLWVGAISIINVAMAMILYKKYRKKVIYWVT